MLHAQTLLFIKRENNFWTCIDVVFAWSQSYAWSFTIAETGYRSWDWISVVLPTVAHPTVTAPGHRGGHTSWRHDVITPEESQWWLKAQEELPISSLSYGKTFVLIFGQFMLFVHFFFLLSSSNFSSFLSVYFGQLSPSYTIQHTLYS